MDAKEWIESKCFKGAGKVNYSDALIAIDIARLEGMITAYNGSSFYAEKEDCEYQLQDLKTKHGIK